MTFASLIQIALWGVASEEDYEDIRDFAKTWRNLAYVELEDLEIRRVPDRSNLENITNTWIP